MEVTDKKSSLIAAIRTDSVVGVGKKSVFNEMEDEEAYAVVSSASSPRAARIMARRFHRENGLGKSPAEDKGLKEDLERRKKVNDKFDVNSRFKFIDEFVKMAISRNVRSLFITGAGGLGKSHAVMEKIQHLEDGRDYVRIKGHCTPKALFDVLRDNDRKLIIFDDCDSPLSDKTSINILKSALDKDGWVNWETTRISGGEDEEEDETAFRFKGTCVFISNLPFEMIAQPLLSRSIFVDVSMTQTEKISRMMTILPNLDVPNSEEERLECLKFMNGLRDEIKDLNIRTFEKVLAIRRDESVEDWERTAEYLLRMGRSEYS